jgi:hypothetical protein|tara:strand:- start:284 stop:397 length:114 start_codon:yes stop_codon:yes gene_type:complete
MLTFLDGASDELAETFFYNLDKKFVNKNTPKKKMVVM